MGDPRKLRKKFEPPSHPWQKIRIEEEKKLLKDYGLKNKKEIWRAKSQIRKYRHLARELVGLGAEERKEKEEILLNKLSRMGVLSKEASLDDILSLKVEDLLERRLQTRIWKMGMGRTATQARQLITHGHIALDGRKVTAPGMVINVEDEKMIDWYGEPVIPALPEPTPVAGSGLQELADEVTPTPEEKATSKEAIDAEEQAEVEKALEKVEKKPKKKPKAKKKAGKKKEEKPKDKKKSGLEEVAKEVTPDKAEKATSKEAIDAEEQAEVEEALKEVEEKGEGK